VGGITVTNSKLAWYIVVLNQRETTLAI